MDACLNFLNYNMILFIFFVISLCSANNTIIINGNTGMIYPGTYPVVVKNGDTLLSCPIPPITSFCQQMVNGKCFVSNNFCNMKKFEKKIGLGSIFETQQWENIMISSISQPYLNPSIHCLILCNGNGLFWEKCMKYLKVTRLKTVNKQEIQVKNYTGETFIVGEREAILGNEIYSMLE